MIEKNAVSTFLSLLSARYSKERAASVEIQAEITALREAWPDTAAFMRPREARLPVCDLLETALMAGQGAAEARLAESLRPFAGHLEWTYSYPDTARTHGLESAMAFTQIIGPRGCFDSLAIRVGLTLIAPGTHYPLHAHPASELYLVVAGTARWETETSPAHLCPPGSLILHSSKMAHAMETGAEPMLAIYSWRGDVVSPSVYL